MAKIIEFYIPKGFHFSKSLPSSGLGKVLEFPTRGETPEISAASAQGTAIAQGFAKRCYTEVLPVLAFNDLQI